MQEKSLALEGPFAGLDLGYLEWGPPDAARTVVCVHGLTRNAHDFDTLAAALAGRGCRVLAVDVVGRGRSSWLSDPHQYTLEVYAAQFGQFFDRLDLAGVDWIGTSMGGLIGMVLAAGPRPPMARLVVNDIGPYVATATLGQIRSYLGLDLAFKDMGELEAHLRLIHASFGPLSDAQWRALAEHSARRTAEGLRLHYDPAIREPFMAAAADDTDLWAAWEGIRCPILVLHGADSALLTADILEQMRGRGPAFELVSFPGIGHAPALLADDQIATVENWLGL